MHFSKRYKTLLICLALSCALVEAQAPDNNSDEAAVRKVLSDINGAWNRHDAAGMAKDFAPDIDQVNVLGRWTHGKEEMEKLYALGQASGGMFLGHGIRTSVVQVVKFVKPDVAFAIVESKDDHNHLRTTYVLTREGARWLIRTQTVSPVRDVPAAKAPADK